MGTILDHGLIWWITAIEIPVLSAMFWMVLKIKSEAQMTIKSLHETLDVRTSQLREGLSAFKLEVVKNYASVMDMKDLETRIVSHLLRIKSKLDQTALKTEALKARKQGLE